MTIGVGVEGPSDKEFWEKVLHKHHRGLRFDIRNMKNRTKLISATPRLVESFRSAGCQRCIILIDRDSEPCPRSVIELFDPLIIAEATQPPAERFVSIVVAVRELEAWYLADSEAVRAVLPEATVEDHPDTDVIGAEGKLRSYWQEQYEVGTPNKIDFARSIAPKFNPTRAAQSSTSFSYFWNRLDLLLTA